MIDLKQIRDNFDDVQARLSRRGPYDLQPLVALDQQQRDLETKRSQLQARGNEIGKQVGQAMKSGVAADAPEILALREEGNQLKT
ncbi:MAG: hypothetical protein WBA43_22275, partial [Elainellaceae cyanobacterium]